MDHEPASASFDRNLRSLVERRISFLLQEAQHRSPRDHAITFTMRAISNYFTVGRDAQSFTIKTLNKNVSSGALELLKTESSFEAWAKLTINEHPVPLAVTWGWLCNQGSSLSLHDVWEHFSKNRMTIITKAEDVDLNDKKLRSSKAPDRYALAGFRTLLLKHHPLEAFKRRDFEVT